MKIIIMAAGVGSRLGSLCNNKPKCLIEGLGETLIQRTVRICKNRGLDDITVVVGYKADEIQQELGNQVNYVVNSVFRKTNSIFSLWLAREKLEGDVILMNGDLFFDERILDLAINQTKPVVMLTDKSRIKTADYRFGFDGAHIVLYGKQLTDHDTDAEYVGIAKIGSSFIAPFRKRLKEMVKGGKSGCWWEEVLYSFIPQKVPIFHSDVSGVFWTEIDDSRDYQRLRKWVDQKEKQNLPRRERLEHHATFGQQV